MALHRHKPVDSPLPQDNLPSCRQRQGVYHRIPDLVSTTRAQPLAPYAGGKRMLAKQICNLIYNTGHTTYAEPFVGMGGIFFRQKTRPQFEVVNDLNREVITLLA